MAEQNSNEEFSNTSFLYGGNAGYIEEIYAQYQKDPNSVSDDWQAFFSELKDDAGDVVKNAEGASWKKSHWPIHANGELVSALDGDWPQPAVEKHVGEKIKAQAAANGEAPDGDHVMRATRDSVSAIMMIRAYRMRGHLHADLDPLKIEGKKEAYNELHPSAYGFTEADYERKIFIDGMLGLEFATVPEMLEILQRTYCSTIGIEFMHISNPQEKGWLQERIEGPDKGVAFTLEGKKAILRKLVEAEGFEQYIDVKYKGTKRFGLDGGEALVPALEQIIKRGGQMGLKEIILGMAHRGRLNVLANVMGKPHRAIFNEFKGGSFKPDSVEGSGDVKYHLGASSDREFDGNEVHLSLTANPSHLEIVNPVVLGKVRAKQDKFEPKNERGSRPRDTVLPLLLHGDAAFAGQGVVAECSFAAKVATEYRQLFRKPVVIDMFCYRRFGHNEGDEPAFTQPLMYKNIRAHETTATLYSNKLIAEGILTADEYKAMRDDWRNFLENEYDAGQNYKPNKADWLDGAWSGLKIANDEEETRRGKTGVTKKKITDIGKKITEVPEGFNVHKTIQRLMDNRRKMIDTGEGIDWGMGEALAFGGSVE